MSPTPRLERSPETLAYLQEYLQDVVESVPEGTHWAAISSDGHRLLGYGDDADQLLRQATELGEPDPIILGYPKFPNGYHI